MVECPKASMYVWRIPEPYAAIGSLEFAKLLNEAKVCVSPGIGFGDYGDTHVRFAPIENRDRTRGDSRYQGDVPRGWSAAPRASAAAARQNKNGSMRLPFFLTPLQSDHQGKTGPNDDHKERPIRHFTTHHSTCLCDVQMN